MQLILFGMSQNVHISSLTAPESLRPKDFQHLSQLNKAVLMPSELPGYANAYNTKRSAKSKKFQRVVTRVILSKNNLSFYIPLSIATSL
jgi:hypothetical protein